MTSPINISKTSIRRFVTTELDTEEPPTSRERWGSVSDEERSTSPYKCKNRLYPSSFPSDGRSKKMYRKSQRKSAYVIAAMEVDTFVQNGGVELVPGSVYIKKMNYTGKCDGETCAIIGISKKTIKSVFDRDSELYEALKSSTQLEDVNGIESLSPYRLISLKYLFKYLYFVYDRELILFNVEPMGEEHNAHMYPSANLCIPGGGMETSDGQCFENCALREFKEETGLVISKNSPNSKLITKQRITFSDRQSMYFVYRVTKFE